MSDIVERLRAMSRNEHDDLSIGDEAADEIVRLRAEVAALQDQRRQMHSDISNLTTIRKQDELVHGNIMGRIAVNLFGRQNNVTDEECVAETARLGYGQTALIQRVKGLEEELRVCAGDFHILHYDGTDKPGTPMYSLRKSYGAMLASAPQPPEPEGFRDIADVIAEQPKERMDAARKRLAEKLQPPADIVLPPLPECYGGFTHKQMIEYAAAVRAATIEECAKVCESQSNDWASSSAWESSHAARDCAAAIRALKAG